MRLSRTGAAVLLAAGCCAAADFRLIDAIKRRDHQQFQALLAQRPDVNVRQPDGATALAWAAFLKDDASAEALLAAGANVNAADEYGETPLTLACANGDAVLVKELLNAGADVHVARWDGGTALMIAASSGNLGLVKQLVGRGADVNAVEWRKGQTALMWAAAEEHPDITRFLIEHGAKIGAQSRAGYTALVFAAMHDDPESVHALLAAGANPNFALPDGTSVLSVALAWRSAKAAAELLDGGADPSIADRIGRTPLHRAAEFGSIGLVDTLIAKHVDLNARTANAAAGGAGTLGHGQPGSQTPLLIAAENNRPEVLHALVAAGADPLIQAQDGTTLLIAAASSGHIEVVRAAYKFDSRVNAVTVSGATAMHAAVAVSGTEKPPEVRKVVEFLAEKGTPLDAKDARGQTPLTIARLMRLDAVADLLTSLLAKAQGSKAQ